MAVDLHLHSYFSADGTLSPEDLAAYFHDGDVAALTDHETLGGAQRFVTAAEARGVRAIIGVEWFLARGDGHLLTYFREVSEDAETFVLSRRKREIEANWKAARALADLFPGFLSPNEILEHHPHPEGLIGVPALLAEVSPHVASRSEAIDAVRKAQRSVRDRPEPLEATDLLARCATWGALPVLAHPFRCRAGGDSQPDGGQVASLITRLEPLGLRGLEVDGWEVSESVRQVLYTFADLFNLVPAAGSDFHSPGKGMLPGQPSFDAQLFLAAFDKPD